MAVTLPSFCMYDHGPEGTDFGQFKTLGYWIIFYLGRCGGQCDRIKFG